MKTVAALLSTLTGVLAMFPGNAAKAETMSTPPHQDYVVLLHGMGRTSNSMKRMECFLKYRGYRVVNVTYRSRKLSIEQLANDYLQPLLEQQLTDPTVKLHFVTHSLGGIILRQYLANHSIPNLGRVIMLGPPNHGSEIIDRLRASLLTREFLGKSARQLGTRTDDLPNRLGPVTFDCGVIAGDRSFNPLFSIFLPGPDDGKVSVASTHVEGMSDYLTVHATHTWLMWRLGVLQQTLSFLNTGCFDHRN